MFLRFVLFKEMDASLRIPLFTASCAFRCCPNSRKQRYWRWFVPLHKAVLLQRRKTRPRQGGVLTLFPRASRVLEGALRVGFCTSAFRQKPQTEAASTTSSLSCKEGSSPPQSIHVGTVTTACYHKMFLDESCAYVLLPFY